MRPLIRAVCLFVFAWLVFAGTAAQAQILIWSLPKEERGWIRFEGTYRQTQSRPESNAGDEILEWRSELVISSQGAVEAEFEGTTTKCRWVEFKSTTKANDLDKQPGPGGVYLYKVLIPENRVIGKPTDDDGIPVTFLPIVKGYRKVGARPVEAVTERALAVYPTIAPVTYYPNLKAEGDEAVEIQLPASNEPVAARVVKGSRVIQNNLTRSTNTATLSLADTLPFGLARYQVSLTREEKGLAATADEFKRKSLVEIDMTAVAKGTDAPASELPESN
jgi:hypothetical protein